MRCNHEDFEYVNEEAYIDCVVIQYKCGDCGRKGFFSKQNPTEKSITWEDSL
jgi:hypothetical protein